MKNSNTLYVYNTNKRSPWMGKSLTEKKMFIKMSINVYIVSLHCII